MDRFRGHRRPLTRREISPAVLRVFSARLSPVVVVRSVLQDRNPGHLALEGGGPDDTTKRLGIVS